MNDHAVYVNDHAVYVNDHAVYVNDFGPKAMTGKKYVCPVKKNHERQRTKYFFGQVKVDCLSLYRNTTLL